ncbi:MAG: guanylate kinase [Bacillota bacterium]
MNTKGLLIVISGPSGVGKGTICKELMSWQLSGLELSVSVTTRKPRAGEVDGKSYFFKDSEQFEKMVSNNEFIEYARVYDNCYGTPKKYVVDKLEEGTDVILEIDVQGAMKVKENSEEAIFIFIMPPSMGELKKRIISRGTESQKDIDKRMQKAFEEVCCSSHYDYIVVNDNVKAAAEKVKCIITAEKCRLKRNHIDFNSFKEV